MIKKLLLVALLLVAVSCATIIKGSKQLITINCNVEEAIVFLDGEQIGYTPFTGEIKKGKKMLMIQKDGYRTYQVALGKSLEGIFWGNIITGGLLGSTTDFATGAAWAYSPSSFQVELMEEGMSLNEFEQRVNLKKFAMIHMSEIANDLSNSEGEYLSSLISLGNLEGDSNNVELIRNILIESEGDQIAFGKLITERIKF